MEVVLEIERVRWRAPDSDYAVLSGVTEEGEEITVTGPLGHVHEGETVELGGGWRGHGRFGRQFAAEAVRLREPVSEAALLGVLSAVKHVGRLGAGFLLDRWGAEVLEVVDADPRARLLEIPGIGKRKIGAAVASWQEARALRAVRLFLDGHGVPAAVAGRVVRALGAEAIGVLTEDPYRLTELDGVGFATADALAVALGTPPDSPSRLRAGVLHALREAEADGHCALPRDELAARARRLLGADVEDTVDGLASAGQIVVEGGPVGDAAPHAPRTRLPDGAAGFG